MITGSPKDMKNITDTEFLVGQYRVDMLRSQVVAQDNIVAMQPKVLQVLLLLAKNQGEVVSHEKILSSVWPDTQVEANALQRCIAQLRKVFGDDAKRQQVIVTHPKIGYSLIVAVDWPKTAVKEQIKQQPDPNNTYNLTIVVLLSLVALALAFLPALKPAQSELPLSRLKRLTTTDSKEFHPAVSPEGNTVVFLRHLGECKSQVWGMDLNTNEAFVLTKEAGIYGAPAWSPDGQKIVYTKAQECDSDSLPDYCRTLVSLPFSLARMSPQSSTPLLQCKGHNLYSPVWLSSNELAFLTIQTQSIKIARLNIADGAQATPQITPVELSKHHNYRLIHLQGLNRLLVLQQKKSGHLSMLLFDLGSGETKTLPLAIPAAHRNGISLNAAWHERNEVLLMGSKGAILAVNLRGEVVEHTLANDSLIDGLDIIEHPSTVIASVGHSDTDVGLLSWSETTDIQYTVLNRSNAEEYNAQFQPQGELIALLSNRSSGQQLWLHNTEKEIRQLTDDKTLPAGVSSFIWSVDGQALFFVSDGQLYITDLMGNIQPLQDGLKVQQIYQSVGDNGLLLSINKQGQNTIVQLDLSDNSIVEHYSGQVRWAQLTDDNALYVTMNNARFAKINDNQAVVVDHSGNKQCWHKFFYRSNQLVFLAEDRRLGALHLEDLSYTALLPQPLNLHQISDITLAKQQLLYQKSVESEREIVMFYHQ